MSMALFNQNAHADNAVPWLNIQSEINFDAMSSADQYENKLRVAEAEVSFEILLQEGIKIFLLNDFTALLNKGDPADERKFSDMLVNTKWLLAKVIVKFHFMKTLYFMNFQGKPK